MAIETEKRLVPLFSEQRGYRKGVEGDDVTGPQPSREKPPEKPASPPKEKPAEPKKGK